MHLRKSNIGGLVTAEEYKTLVQELMTGAETGNAGGYVGPDARKYLP